MFSRLSEKDKRLYAGVEALKFPYGGISYIAQLFACSRNTILRGIIELGVKETIPRIRDRKAGGGRKRVIEKQADINAVFLSVLKEHTAGDPMDEKVKWTNLTKADILRLVKFAENEAGIILKFKHKTRHAKDRLYRKSH